MTDSRIVAKVFKRTHKSVLRSIRALECSPEFKKAHFCALVGFTRVGAVNKRSEYYEITREGFYFLGMGFTGAEAAVFKEAYINAFVLMEKMIYDLNNDLITKFLHALEAEKQSFALASMAGRVLQKRKDEKQSNKSQISALRDQIQPLLPFISIQ